MDTNETYLTDKFGMSFYAYCVPRFQTSLDTHRNVNRKNPISGHQWTERVLKDNHVSIAARIERAYQRWLLLPETANRYHYLNAYPRTPKETDSINSKISS